MHNSGPQHQPQSMVGFQDAAPSFMDRMYQDNEKRQQDKMINEHKKQCEEAGTKKTRKGEIKPRMPFRDPRNQGRRGSTASNPAENDNNGLPNPTVMSHQSWKCKEKQRGDGQWGPLGW